VEKEGREEWKGNGAENRKTESSEGGGSKRRRKNQSMSDGGVRGKLLVVILPRDCHSSVNRHFQEENV